MAFRNALVNSSPFDPNRLRPGDKRQRLETAPMQPIGPVFDRLQLSAYTETFIEQGFETWEDVLDITENDLEQLNVRLGHRRRLQREIAEVTGRSISDVRGDAERQTSTDPPGDSRDPQQPPGQSTATGKRRYRRHPKPDPNAPERPPSAYVLFSNQVREDLKAENLSFTEMAKVVGEKWQQLDTEGREPFETEANDQKDTYNAKLAEYKKTSDYKEYSEYLTNFKAAQQAATSGQAAEGKRVKLERSGEGSSRGSQGTPTTSVHGSPVNNTTSLSNTNLTETAGGSLSSPTSLGYTPNYQSPGPGRIGAGAASRPLLASQIAPEHVGAYSSPNALPPISTDMAQRMLPRRTQNPAPPFLSRAGDTSTQPSSSLSGASMASNGPYSPTTHLSGQMSATASASESGTPYSQHHGLKNLNLGYAQDRPSSSGPGPYFGHSSAPSPVHPPYHGPESSSRVVLPPLGQPGTATQQQHQRMDGLSVLALAGRMVDGDREHNPTRDIPGFGM